MTGGAEIGRIELYSTHASQATGRYYNFRILFCETNVDGLSTSFEENYSGGTPFEALACDTLTILWADSSPGWNGFDLDTPWIYDGSGNLIVEFQYMGSSGTTVNARAGYVTPADRCLDGGYPSCPTGELMSFLTCMRIHFTPTGIHGGEGSWTAPGPGLVAASPVTDALDLTIAAPTGSEAVLRAWSIDGRCLGTLWRGFPEEEGTRLSIPAEGLPEGLLLLVLESGESRSPTKVVLLP